MPSILLPVPHYKQAGKYNCLPACARMTLDYLGISRSEAELVRQLDATPLGTPGSRLLRLRSRRLRVAYVPFTLPLLKSQLQNQTPVIVLVRTIFLDYWQDDVAHAVVVVGYNDDHLLLNDPAFDHAPQQASLNGFLAAWGEFDFLTGLITRR